MKGIEGRYESRASSMLKKTKSAPSTRQVEMCPHLRRVIDDQGDEITLLRKANERKRTSWSENPNQLKGKTRRFRVDRRFDLGTRKLPQVLLKYRSGRMAQSKATTSTKLRIKSINMRHQLMAQM